MHIPKKTQHSPKILLNRQEPRPMCLAIPGQIISLSNSPENDHASLALTGRVNFSGITKEISLAFTPEAKVNDYVVVHAGCALAILDEAEALASLQAFQEFAGFENET